ncbi:MAG: sodium-dependent transporter [Acidobacteria bacterium]|nr:MAG: sodium-dependent transporter [Acidobacteriota bacterium]REK07091.1 MAG: sodium-dependent transporter [Acidobacteriota bacterium]
MSRGATFFTSRWGLMLAMLGMAVGTGNIWRFPRIVAGNGGGSFLVAWVVFLFLWSIPLILLEFALGKGLRRGTVGGISGLLGEKYAWMGAWIGWSAAAVGFYYAVVMGWTLRYLFVSVNGQLTGADSQQMWDGFAFQPSALLFHFIAVAMAVGVVVGGAARIEQVARILMPLLIGLVVVLAVRAVTLPGASAGLEFMFRPNWADLGSYEIWLQALTQNAWDTGAGWGLITTYAIYARKNDDTNLNAVTLAFGNNSISLLAGILVLCTVFSFTDAAVAASQLQGQTNEGLTFLWIPQLFDQMPAGRIFMIFFFAALVFAAWTSLVSLFELVARVFTELGFERRKVLPWLGVVVWLAGVPSALSQDVFTNQDFVWSVGLMLSGVFFAFAVWRYGPGRFRREFLEGEHQDLRIGVWWEWAVRLVVVQGIVLVLWWLWQVRASDLWAPDGLANLFTQWAVVLVVFLLANRWMARRLALRGESTDPASERS